MRKVNSAITEIQSEQVISTEALRQQVKGQPLKIKGQYLLGFTAVGVVMGLFMPGSKLMPKWSSLTLLIPK